MNAKSPGKFRNSTTSESLRPAFLIAFFQLKVLYTFEPKTHTTSNIQQQQCFSGCFPGLHRVGRCLPTAVSSLLTLLCFLPFQTTPFHVSLCYSTLSSAFLSLSLAHFPPRMTCFFFTHSP